MPLNLENPLWDYALDLYGRPGVEDACLELQEAGLGINRLLFCCWLSTEGRLLRPGELEASEAARWQRELTAPLRALRYRVRGEKRQDPGLEPLYRLLRQAELAAEQVELARLFALGRGWPVVENCGDELLLRNLAGCLALASVPDGAALRRNLAELLQAAVPGLDSAAVRRLRW